MTYYSGRIWLERGLAFAAVLMVGALTLPQVQAGRPIALVAVPASCFVAFLACRSGCPSVTIDGGRLYWRRWFTRQSVPLADVELLTNRPGGRHWMRIRIRGRRGLRLYTHTGVSQFIPYLMEQAPNVDVDFEIPVRVLVGLRWVGNRGPAGWYRRSTR